MNVANDIGGLIKSSNGTKYIKTEFGDTKDIIDQVVEADAYDLDDVEEFAQEMRGGDIRQTCRNIFDFIVDNIQYKEDPDGQQWVCSPSWLYQRGYGDCKSFSKFIGSCLKQLNIDYLYRFCSGYASGDMHHVFVVAFDEAGRPIAIDATPDNANSRPTFGEEPYYVKKIDRRPAASKSAKVGNRGMGKREYTLNIPALSADEATAWYYKLVETDPVAASLFEKKWRRTASVSGARIGLKIFPQLKQNIIDKKVNKKLGVYFKIDFVKSTPYFLYLFWPYSKNKVNYLPAAAVPKLRRAILLFAGMGLKYGGVYYDQVPMILMPIFFGLMHFMDSPDADSDTNLQDKYRELFEKPFKDTYIYKEHVVKPTQAMYGQYVSTAGSQTYLLNTLIKTGVKNGDLAPPVEMKMWEVEFKDAPAFLPQGYYTDQDTIFGSTYTGVTAAYDKKPEDVIDEAFVAHYMQQPNVAGRLWPQKNVPGKDPDKAFVGLSLGGLTQFDVDKLKEKYPVGSYVYVFTSKVTNDLQRPINGKHKVLAVGSPYSANMLVIDVPQNFSWDTAWDGMVARISNNPAIMAGVSPGQFLDYNEAKKRFGLSGRIVPMYKKRIGEPITAAILAVASIISAVIGIVSGVVALIKSLKNKKLADNVGPETVPSPPKDFEVCYEGVENGVKAQYCADYSGKWWKIDADGNIVGEVPENQLPFDPDALGGGGAFQAGMNWLIGLGVVGAGLSLLKSSNTKPKRTTNKKRRA